MEFLLKKIEQVLKIQKRWKTWQKIVAVLACFTVAVTTYALILPAITLNQDTADEKGGIVLEETEDVVQEETAAGNEVQAGREQTENTEEVSPETTADGLAEIAADSGQNASDEAAVLTGIIYPESLNVRTEKRKDADVLETLPQGTSVTVLEDQGDGWLFVSTPDGQNGYVKAAYVLLPGETVEQKKPAMTFELVADKDSPDAEISEAYINGTFAGPVKVHVEAPVGAFPAGTTMKVRPIAEEQVREAIDTVVPEPENVSRVSAVDITFIDVCGDEIEPDTEIKVSLTSTDIPVGEKPVVVHVDNEGQAEMVEAKTEEENIVFESDKFSVYVIVGTEPITVPFTASDGSTYEVTVKYNQDAGIPENSYLKVSEVTEDNSKYDEYVAQAADAIESRVFDLDYIKLLDIEIVDEYGNKTTLNAPVDVQIKLLDKEQVVETTKIVHFEGTNEVPVVMDSSVEGDKVEFSTNGFSVYAVIDKGEGGNEARATVNFYGKDTTTPLATLYVKNSDVLLGDGERQTNVQYIEDIVYDPGCGELNSTKKELFDGWVISTVNTTDGSSYTIETEGKTIEEVRQYLEQLEITEGDVVNVYAKIIRAITISYEGESANTLIGSVVLKVLGSDDPNSSDNLGEYTINMAYTPATSTQAFMGWNVAEGASNILSATYNDEPATAPYQNGTKITVKGDVKLSVNAPYGHWLVFEENGHGATYNAPQFVKDTEKTKEPSLEMERLGYSFGGWYKLKENVSISAVPKDSDGDYIISDEYFEEFSFGEELEDNLTVYAKWISAETAHYTVIVWKERMTDTYADNGGTGEGKEKHYDFAESYTFEGPVGQNATAVSNGTTYVTDGDDAGTRYYNARIRGTDVNTGNVDNTIKYTGYHCADYDKNVVVEPEGNTVVNVYYDRNTVTYTFYTYGQNTSDDGTWYLCKENGTRMYVEGDHSNRDNPITIRNEDGEYNQDGYNGIVRHDDGRTYYYSESGACRDDEMREAHWEKVTNTGSQWNVYQKSTGLYGEPLNWPEDTSIWWYEGHNNTTGTGTRMTYKDAFLPTDDTDMTVEYWGTNASATGTIHFWTQDVNGTTYTEQVTVSAGTANFLINDKFTGFYPVQYRVDGQGSWQPVGAKNDNGIYGSGVSYGNRLDIRYNRITASITYLDGAFYDGSGNPIEDETPQADPFKTTQEYFYGSDVSSYNIGGNDYYTPPEKKGYTFAGWYADDACTVEYDFGTMPASGITVYAKWILNEYRVFLHPNVPETDTSLNWGSETQEMNFRVSSGSKVSAPTGTRTEYKFIGWYLDENCTEVFDSSRFVLNDTTVTTPYDKSVDMTDVMNKYGNIEGTGSNSDATGYNGGDRFWITKKLDLYAKWRAELIGADGIGVKYDANGGSYAPSDMTQYLDNTDTVAQGASTPPDDSQQFLYWVMQKWDETENTFVDLKGEEYHIYPGASFTVLKSNALVEELEGSTTDDPKYRYTVQLRAEYGPKETPTPTHLTWYANGGISADGTVDRYTDPELKINEAVTIRPDNTFKRDGYSFLGWARVDSTTEGYEIAPKNLTESDLFLKFEDGKYFAKDTATNEWKEVEQVAADERLPYHDMYAVWKAKTYSVTVTKHVTGLAGDDEIPFSFNPSVNGDTTTFRLVGKETGTDIQTTDEPVHIKHTKVYENVPYGTDISVTELLDDNFNVSELYTITGADNNTENVNNQPVDNGTVITVKGDVQITFNNTRETKLIRIMKTTADQQTPLGGAVFTTTINGTTYTFTSDSDGFLKNEAFETGTIMVPYGTYNFTETKAPDGYLPLEGDITIIVNDDRISAAQYTVKEPEGDVNYYTIIIPNNNGNILPSTGGFGTTIYYIAGLLMLSIAGFMLLTRKENVKRISIRSK